MITLIFIISFYNDLALCRAKILRLEALYLLLPHMAANTIYDVDAWVTTISRCLLRICIYWYFAWFWFLQFFALSLHLIATFFRLTPCDIFVILIFTIFPYAAAVFTTLIIDLIYGRFTSQHLMAYNTRFKLDICRLFLFSVAFLFIATPLTASLHFTTAIELHWLSASMLHMHFSIFIIQCAS